MPRNTPAQDRRISPSEIAATFWASKDPRAGEAQQLARYGVPAALRLWKPVRVDEVVFEESGFEFVRLGANREEGVRAFLFLITNDRGDALDIVAWAPMLKRCSSWIGKNRQPSLEEAA